MPSQILLSSNQNKKIKIHIEDMTYVQGSKDYLKLHVVQRNNSVNDVRIPI